MNNLKERLLDKWDSLIYKLSWRSLNKMMKREVGRAYLFKLQMDSWLEENPVPKQLKEATEIFHNAMQQHKMNNIK